MNNIIISPTKLEPAMRPIEIVERKGLGHPDTLSDALGEHLSCTYSNYTRTRFGAILRHQFDKVALMCGRAKVSFGDGEMLEPIRVLINGRASACLGDEEIPVRSLLIDATRDFFAERFPMLDFTRDFKIMYEVRSGLHTTTGGIFDGKDEVRSATASIHYRFHPRSLADLPETQKVQSNDTSAAVGWAPFSPLEKAVLKIEHYLNNAATKLEYPWLGSDIKIMAVRSSDTVKMVIAVPLLSRLTQSGTEYFARLAIVEQLVRREFEKAAPSYRLDELVLNSGDDVEGRKLYMNFTGSSIESGDEGMVGRGNRIGGVIAPCRPYTMEGLGGKNPRYHVGKVYSAAAYDIAHRLHDELGLSTNVFLVNRMAEPLSHPWFATVETLSMAADKAAIANIITDVCSDLEKVTAGILEGNYPLF
jgi:S-adenosylmethionine synthetase